MALMDLLKPADPANTRHRVAVSLAEAIDTLESARSLWSNLSADDEVAGRSPSVATVKAAEALTTAKQEVDRLTGVLQTLDNRANALRDKLQRDVAEAQWTKVERLAAARSKKAITLSQAAATFAEAYEGMCRATRELHDGVRAVVKEPDMDALLLRELSVEGPVRQELLRLGVRWAFSWPWGAQELPEFLPPFLASEDLVKRMKGANLG